MKILLISGFRIFPTSTGGHIRTASIARALARLGYEVLIYSLAGRNDDYGPKVLLRARHRIDRIEPRLAEETNLGLGYGVLQTVGRRFDYPRVWQHSMMAHGLIPARLKAALENADIVVSDMPWCPRIPGPWTAKPWFLLSHNLEHRLLEQGDGLYRRAAGWMRDIESEAPGAFSDIFACAEEDRDYFRAHDRAGIRKVPILRGGVDPLAYVAADGVRERIRQELGLSDADTLLVFSGSKFRPNLEALEVLKAFCKAEAAFLARERVYILALGSMCSTASRDGALIATGRVPEIVPYFAAADAGVNPITTGSGANVKLFEYLAARLPVISTLFGVRGTVLEANVDFVPYAPETFRAAIEQFVHGRTRAEWRLRAEEVWQRHRGSCDIQEIVKATIEHLPEFKVEARQAGRETGREEGVEARGPAREQDKRHA